MEMSKQMAIGLKRLVNKTLCNDESFDSILNNTALILSQQSKPAIISWKELSMSKPDITKECLASLLMLLVECSRHNIDAESLISNLENHNISSPRTVKISELYQAHRSKFKANLELIGITHPKIVNFNWRFDFCIKSSSLEHEARGIYLIQLEVEEVQRRSLTQEKPKLKKITFTCSLQQLQKLVAKLRDATRLIQSMASNK